LVTGSTGFIGSYLVPELIQAGHGVVGLTRSDTGAEALTRAGAEVFFGDVNDLDRVRSAAAGADGVIHAAFNHDFTRLKENCEQDRKVIEALGQALAGSDRPLVVTSGTGVARRSKIGALALESDDHVTSSEAPRAAAEEAADALIDKGGRIMVMRLPQVHDTRKFGRISLHIQLARQNGRVGYVGEGKNRLAAVHVSDAAHLFRLVLEKGKAGARYNAVGEEGVAMRDIAEVIGTKLRLPVESIPPDRVSDCFGSLAGLVAVDMAASGAATQRELAWNPMGPDLLTDLRNMEEGVPS
jgi:nucleoside-diphosphate-sugar epimerase